MMDAQVIVVGGGVVGLWTANTLVKQGVKTTLFEQFPYPHTRGSSHGQSRITRTSYPTKEYSALMPEAHKKWRELQKECGKEILIDTNLLSIYDFEKDRENFLTMIENLKRHNINHYVLPGGSLEQRFPGLVSSDKEKAIYDLESGILKADSCTQALRECFQKCGGELHNGEPVVSLKPINESKVEVYTNRRKYTCSSVVLSCGTYVNNLLSTVDFQLPLSPVRVEVTYWKDTSGCKYSLEKNFPLVIIYSNPHVYSIPSYEYPGLIKICRHGGTDCDPTKRDEMTAEIVSKRWANMNSLKEVIQTYYTDVDAKEPAVTEICMYTETPDEKFILDFHPKHKNIVIGAGFSGHGFKTSPSVGHILANMATGQTPPYSLEPFSYRRFQSSSKL